MKEYLEIKAAEELLKSVSTDEQAATAMRAAKVDIVGNFVLFLKGLLKNEQIDETIIERVIERYKIYLDIFFTKAI